MRNGVPGDEQASSQNFLAGRYRHLFFHGEDVV
jgi:hypothetical protein